MKPNYNLMVGARVLYRYSVDGKIIVGRVRWLDRTAGLIEVATNISTPQNQLSGLVMISAIESWQPIDYKSKLHRMFYIAYHSNRAINSIHKRYMVSIKRNIFNRLHDKKMNWLNTY